MKTERKALKLQLKPVKPVRLKKNSAAFRDMLYRRVVAQRGFSDEQVLHYIENQGHTYLEAQLHFKRARTTILQIVNKARRRKSGHW